MLYQRKSDGFQLLDEFFTRRMRVEKPINYNKNVKKGWCKYCLLKVYLLKGCKYFNLLGFEI
jgi:hypothetical protein